jgi:hypothetical protein
MSIAVKICYNKFVSIKRPDIVKIFFIQSELNENGNKPTVKIKYIKRPSDILELKDG